MRSSRGKDEEGAGEQFVVVLEWPPSNSFSVWSSAAAAAHPFISDLPNVGFFSD